VHLRSGGPGVQPGRAGGGALVSGEPASLATEREIRAICEAWSNLGLRNRDGSLSVASKVEARTLRARLKGGRTLEELRAVVAGAALFDEAWLSKGRAMCAFAVAFCEKRGAFDRAAHEGRKRLSPKPKPEVSAEQDDRWQKVREDLQRGQLDLQQRLRDAGLLVE
jgi:hypothetical protein